MWIFRKLKLKDRLSLSLLSTIILSVLMGCGIDRRNIDEWVGNGDITSLKEYINSYCNSRDVEKVAISNYAVREMMKKKVKGASSFLEGIYFTRETEKSNIVLAILILDSFSESGVAFDGSEKLLRKYYELILSNSTNSDESRLLVSIERNLSLSSAQNKSDFLFRKGIERINTNDIVNANRLFSKIETLADDNQSQLKLVTSELSHLILSSIDGYNNEAEMDSLRNKKDNLIKKYKEVTDFLEQQKRSIENENSDVWQRISSLENNIESLREEINDFKYIYLTGYICGLTGSGSSYEINTGGRYHAILTTSTTEYNTKGYFEIPARKTGTLNVTVKEEYGGFAQVWNEYEEVTPREIRANNSRKEELVEDQREISKLKQGIAPSMVKIKSIENLISKAEQARDNAAMAFERDKTALINALDKKKESLTFEVKKIILLM